MTDDSRSHLVVPTLLSLWSAMLGGAVGGITGNIGSNLVCSGVIGFFVGAAASVIVHMFLYSILYVITYFIFKVDFGEVTIVGYKGDLLASVLGGIAGFCSAALVTVALPAHSLGAFRTFSVCWSAAAFVPLVLMLILVWRAEH